MRNIFQLKKSDLLSLIDAVNAHAGEYIIISRTPDGLEISIDELLLRRYIMSYYTKHKENLSF